MSKGVNILGNIKLRNDDSFHTYSAQNKILKFIFWVFSTISYIQKTKLLKFDLSFMYNINLHQYVSYLNGKFLSVVNLDKFIYMLIKLLVGHMCIWFVSQLVALIVSYSVY